MSMSQNPWDFPEWHGFARETSLSVGLICAGVNSLGRATYADLGEYYVALFGISNGVERLGKLVWAADFRLDHGRSPTDGELRKLGHKLDHIVDAVRNVERKRKLPVQYSFPEDELTGAIIESLTTFADASRGRYANFETIRGAPSPYDPVTHWWEHVVERILARHFRGTRHEERAEANATLIQGLIGESSHVLHHDETGQRISTIIGGSMRTAENGMAQKYGRYYTLRLVRWMSDVFKEVGSSCPAGTPDPVLFGHDERVRTFLVPDQFLLTRKRWPLS